jgi:hypothetical protein
LYTFFPQEKFQTVYSIEYLSTIGEVINLQGGHMNIVFKRKDPSEFSMLDFTVILDKNRIG